MMQKGFLNKIGVVHVAINCFNMDNTVIGVYSSVDSALDSVQSFLEQNYPNTQWMWNGEDYALENVDDEWHVVYVLPFQIDNDKWRRHEQS
jgi:hypothetical protein